MLNLHECDNLHQCERPANGWLVQQEQQFFYSGIQALEKCWTKCISVAGDHAEVTKYDVHIIRPIMLVCELAE